MKKCIACKDEKELSAFYPCGTTYTPRCKPCHREEMRSRRSGANWKAYYQKNREKILKAQQRYHQRKKRANAKYTKEQPQTMAHSA